MKRTLLTFSFFIITVFGINLQSAFAIAPIAGPTSVCIGSTIPLTDTTLGGTWSSGTVSVATIDIYGVVTGVAAGTTVITYTYGTYVTYTVTVDAPPLPITGSSMVCVGASLLTTLTDATTGGTWSSSATGVATISAGGVIDAITTGSAIIYYTLGACVVGFSITVYPAPYAAPISGGTAVCIGSTLNLTDSVTGGVWWVTNAVASVSGIGVVSGVTYGVDTINYTATNSCGSANAAHIVTVTPVPAPTVTVSGIIISSNTYAGAAYQWYDNGALLAGATNATYAPIDSGHYSIIVTIPGSCQTLSNVVYYLSSAYFVDTCDVILAGRFVQTAISMNGSFGSSVPLPPNIHANDTPNTCNCNTSMYHGNSLGFVSDPDMDGWNVGTPPYFGDYFLPGNAFEGWSIELGGIQYNAYQSNLLTCGTPYTSSSASPPYSLTGNNVSFNVVDSLLTSTWQGNLGGFLDIKQIITLDTNSLYFTMNITITNTSHSAVNDIYYWRVINPQNEQRQTGNYNTNNTIAYQMPDSVNTVLVTATGPTYPRAYLGLGTSDTNSKCFISRSWPPTLLADQYYSMVGAGIGNTYCAGCTDNGNYGLGLVYYVRHLAPVDSATDSVYRTVVHHPHPANSSNFSSIYSFSASTSDSVLFNTDTTTFVSKLSKNNPTMIYPNPATDAIKITNLNIGDQIILNDMVGRVLRTWYVDNTGNNTYSLSGLAAGTYLFNIHDNTGHIKKRDVVQKL